MEELEQLVARMEQAQARRRALAVEAAELDERQLSIAAAAPDPPSGPAAFELVAVGWLLELDVRAFLHPAVQQALHDAHQGAHLEGGQPHLSYEQALLPRAFACNYDDFHLLRWKSNIAARAQMLRDFPAAELGAGGLPRAADLDAQTAADVGQFVEHRRSLPVIVRPPRRVREAHAGAQR